jgi:hypothetical protein
MGLLAPGCMGWTQARSEVRKSGCRKGEGKSRKQKAESGNQDGRQRQWPQMGTDGTQIFSTQRRKGAKTQSFLTAKDTKYAK